MISRRILNIEESSTLAMAQKSRDLVKEGKKIINLSLGEPDFNTPNFIKEAAKKAIDEDFSKYTPVGGYDDLREAISEKFRRDNNLIYDKNQIICSTGAKQSLMQLLLCILNPNDEIILPSPYWVSYFQMIKFAKAKPVILNTSIENNFKISAKDLEKKINTNTKAFLINSPSNPTGAVYTKEELREISNIIKKHPKVIVISDEIYEHINFTKKHTSIGEFLDTKKQVVTVNGLSKGFAMTGWRLGYLGAPTKITKACIKLQGQFTSGTCSITQRAAISALQKKPDFTKEMKNKFLIRRNLTMNLLKNIEGIKVPEPKGAFYIFADFSYYFNKKYKQKIIKNNDELSLFLLEEGEVATVSGSAFGDNNCIRISIASSEKDLKTAISRIKKCLSKLS
ncbi:MAG: aspartate aminotransferase [Flavobacteriales bacterium]|nr:aspartate aminotransferase [Flavobacteriales bacterium]